MIALGAVLRLLAIRTFAVVFLSALVLASAEGARADVTSWLAVGGGAASQRDRDAATRQLAPLLTYSIGVGSPAAGPLVVGGLLRGTTRMGLGTDLALALRASTGGFARGDWGLAVEAGVAFRPWRGGSFGEWPLQGVLTAGLPWGFQLAVGAELWSVTGGTPAEGLFVALELDLLRLTVMRQGSTERWWRNPLPAGGHLTAGALTERVRPEGAAVARQP